MIYRKKLLLIVICLVVIVGLVVVYIQSMSTTTPKQQYVVSRSTIEAVALKSLQASDIIKDSDYTMITKDVVMYKNWVYATIILTNEPIYSNARNMQYVFERKNDSLRLLAFSGDGFSMSFFPEGTSPDILKGLEKLQ